MKKISSTKSTSSETSSSSSSNECKSLKRKPTTQQKGIFYNNYQFLFLIK